MTASFAVYCDPRLKILAATEADKAGVPLSEYVARVLAEKLDRPDLGVIPRKSMGRPRKPVQLAS